MKNKINEKESNKNNISNDKSLSLLKLNVTEHYEMKSKNNVLESNRNKEEKQKIYFINDYYINEEKKNSPKTLNGKDLININEIVGEDSVKPITLQMIDTHIDNFASSKILSKSFGFINLMQLIQIQG